MLHLLTFTEGVLAFLSPCVAPLLPAYVSYFAAGESDPRRARRNAFGFFLGLAVVFVALGVLAGVLGARLSGRPVEILGGALLMLFGLHYIGVLQLPNLHRMRNRGITSERLKSLSFPWAVIFGGVLALCWVPCVGPLLGAALLKAGMVGGVWSGGVLLFLFALGFGLPFVLSALLIDRFKGALSVLKRHNLIINRIAGALLFLVGLAMALGILAHIAH